MKKKKIVIVMPAYFAEKTIERTYSAIPKKLRIPSNIILVDDASKDNTVKIAKKLGVNVFVHKNNLGYGGNQKTCYQKALEMAPDIVVMIHPDYQYDASMTQELIRPIEDGWLDIMLGNRIRTRKEAMLGGMPTYKYYFNRMLTMIENITLGLNLGEYHTGFRAYSKKALLSVPFKNFSDDFVFDQEMLISAAYANLKMGEVPVPVRYFSEASSINFPRSLKYGLAILVTLLKYILDKNHIFKFKIFRHQQ